MEVQQTFVLMFHLHDFLRKLVETRPFAKMSPFSATVISSAPAISSSVAAISSSVAAISAQSFLPTALRHAGVRYDLFIVTLPISFEPHTRSSSKYWPMIINICYLHDRLVYFSLSSVAGKAQVYIYMHRYVAGV